LLIVEAGLKLCRLSWPKTCNPHSLVSQVLVLQECAIMPSAHCGFDLHFPSE
jgi:hypothetical protein